MRKANLHQSFPKDWEGREALRDKGQFWTPSWLAKAMVAYVTKDTNLVFDPATGKGAFFEALTRASSFPRFSFSGTDIDDNVLSDPIYRAKILLCRKKRFH